MEALTTYKTENITLSEVKQVFAEITRYPEEILDPEAHLEEDLGIDSVKLGEIYAVLKERYQLPEDLHIPPEQLTSIQGVYEALVSYASASETPKETHNSTAGKAVVPLVVEDDITASSQNNPPVEVLETNKPIVPPASGAVTDEKSILETITAVFAEITRYPEEILDPEANLEEDLGIDSVKLGEIYAVIKELYHLPDDLQLPPEQLTSIRGISEALAAHVTGKETLTMSVPPIKESMPAQSTPPVNKVTLTASEDQVEATITHDGAKESKNKPAADEKEVLRTVTEIFAEVTRYPEEILDPEASLEEDLGIDSVKLGEVYAILKERFSLSDDQTVAPEQLTSIAGVASAITTLLNEGTAVGIMEAEPQTEQPTQNGTPATLPQNGTAIATPPNRVADAVPHPPALQNESVVGFSNGSMPTPSLSGQRQHPYGDFFKDKKVFISGSGRGLGKDIATYLAELGATVVINSFHSRMKGEETCEEIKSKGHKALHIWGSLANPEHVERMWDEVEQELGSIHYFIHAASNGMLDKLENITADHWKKAFQTNVVGFHQSALRAKNLMKKNGGGHIITISSPAAHGYVDYFAVQGAAKAALESLTRSMAVEFYPDNVLVNCISPGPIYGELLSKWPNSDQLIKSWEDKTFYNRLCEPRDVSKSIAFLLSDEAKLFNASILIQDGGISSAGKW